MSDETPDECRRAFWCRRATGPWRDMEDRLAAAEAAVERVRAVATGGLAERIDEDARNHWQWCRQLLDAMREALEGTQEAHTAPLSAEQPTSGQVDDPDGYGAWIRQAFERGDDEGWGA